MRGALVHLSRPSRGWAAKRTDARSVATRVRVVPRAPPSPSALRTSTSPAKDGRGVPVKRDTVFVFARAPRLGAVKRRLARDIGARAALDFHRATMLTLLRCLAAERRCCTVLAVTPDRARFPLPVHVPRLDQGHGDLGTRMQRAAARVPHGRVVIIGCDIPDARPADVLAAFRALGRADAVFGPAADGGYWLVGFSPAARRAPSPRCAGPPGTPWPTRWRISAAGASCSCAPCGTWTPRRTCTACAAHRADARAASSSVLPRPLAPATVARSAKPVRSPRASHPSRASSPSSTAWASNTAPSRTRPSSPSTRAARGTP